MKKLSLEKLKLAAEDVLQRSQLAGIYGGSGGSDQCPNEPGTCGYNPGTGYDPLCGYSLATVTCWVTKYGGNYCCDSCGGEASYC